MNKAVVQDFIAELELEAFCCQQHLDRLLTTADVYRPGMELAGYMAHYPASRVQVMGQTEWDFCGTLSPEVRVQRAEQLLKPGPPCIVFSRGLKPPQEMIATAQAVSVPLLGSLLPTTRLISRLSHWLDNRLAPRKTIHGVLMDLFGVGILITGDSGIGKSETALELVKRGHRLVADDAVDIRRPAQDILLGEAPDLTRNLMELRGIGIIDVAALYGAGAVRPDKRVELVVNFKEWQEGADYDRLGLEHHSFELFDVTLQRLEIPVAPGRNLASIVETAAVNYRAKAADLCGASEVCRRLDVVMNKGNPD